MVDPDLVDVQVISAYLGLKLTPEDLLDWPEEDIQAFHEGVRIMRKHG